MNSFEMKALRAWRRSVVKSGGRGQSGQAIKLFQAPRKISSILTRVFHPSWCETCRVIQQQLWTKNVTFYGVKTYSDPSNIFQGVRTPTPMIYAPALAVTTCIVDRQNKFIVYYRHQRQNLIYRRL